MLINEVFIISCFPPSFPFHSHRHAEDSLFFPARLDCTDCAPHNESGNRGGVFFFFLFFTFL